MKVAYIFSTVNASYILEKMIIPQLEAGTHGMLVMGCDQCCELRRIEDRIHDGFRIGCFPNLYQALMAAGGIDQAITL